MQPMRRMQPDPTEPEPEVNTYCNDLGLTPSRFSSRSRWFLFGDLAEDFTANELDGKSFQLSRDWTGCDSYIFFAISRSTMQMP